LARHRLDKSVTLLDPDLDPDPDPDPDPVNQTGSGG
jgi:hypothetical protein